MTVAYNGQKATGKSVLPADSVLGASDDVNVLLSGSPSH